MERLAVAGRDGRCRPGAVGGPGRRRLGPAQRRRGLAGNVQLRAAPHGTRRREGPDTVRQVRRRPADRASGRLTGRPRRLRRRVGDTRRGGRARGAHRRPGPARARGVAPPRHRRDGQARARGDPRRGRLADPVHGAARPRLGLRPGHGSGAAAQRRAEHLRARPGQGRADPACPARRRRPSARRWCSAPGADPMDQLVAYTGRQP